MWLLLLDKKNNQGELSELSGIAFTPNKSEKSKEFNADLYSAISTNAKSLLPSANIGLRHAAKILFSEDIEKTPLNFHFECDSTEQNAVLGNSSDLAFALVTLAEFTQKNHSKIAATGVLLESGYVEKVDGINEKIKAATENPDVLKLFIPNANENDISEETWSLIKHKNLDVYLVSSLNEAALKLGVEIKSVWQSNPYLGLNAFKVEDAPIYFGRDEDVKEFISHYDKLEGRKNVLVMGASGVGKSSFIQAGVLSYFIKNTSTHNLRYDVWRINQGSEINELNLVTHLFPSLQKLVGVDSSSSAPEQSTPQTLDELIDFVKNNSHENSQYFWVIDQFEEFFTTKIELNLKQLFSKFLLGLSNLNISIIATLRNEFYAEYTEFSVDEKNILVEIFPIKSIFNLGSVKRENLRQVIEKPATLANISFEQKHGKSVVDDLLVEADASSLPLIEFVLSYLYDKRDQKHSLITFKSLRELGGVGGVIQKIADDAIVTELTNNKANVESIFRSLVTIDLASNRVSRRTLNITTLLDGMLIESNILNKLSSARILNVWHDPITNDVMTELSHEKIISVWPVLNETIQKFNALIKSRDYFIPYAKKWVESDKDSEWFKLNKSEIRDAKALINNLRDFEFDSDVISYLRRALKYYNRAIFFKFSFYLFLISLLTFLGYGIFAALNDAQRAREHGDEVISKLIKVEPRLKDFVHEEFLKMKMSQNSILYNNKEYKISSDNQELFIAQIVLVISSESIDDKYKQLLLNKLPKMKKGEIDELYKILASERMQLIDKNNQFLNDINELISTPENLENVLLELQKFNDPKKYEKIRTSLLLLKQDSQKKYELFMKLKEISKERYLNNRTFPAKFFLEDSLSASWYGLILKKYETAEDIAKDGLEVDLNYDPLEINLAHAIALQGREKEAFDIYIKNKDLRLGDKTWREVILDDFSKLEEKGIKSPVFSKVRDAFHADISTKAGRS